MIWNLILSATALCGMTESSREKQIEVFVLAGQSNMQGWQGNAEHYPRGGAYRDRQVKFYWETPGHSSSQGNWTFLQPQGGRFPAGHFGPEVTLARQFIDLQRSPAIFKYSLGSTSLARDWKTPGEGGMYDKMVSELKSAMTLLAQDGLKAKIRGFFWVQGESDAETLEMAEAYEARLHQLIRHFRRVVARDAELPVVLGVDEQHPYVKMQPRVVEAQVSLARNIGFADYSSMVGLEKADATHLTPKGLEEHGRRLFSAYLKAASFPLSPSADSQHDREASHER
jgi:hypothetical protein